MTFGPWEHPDPYQQPHTLNINLFKKTLGWTHSFEGIHLLWPSLPGKVVELFFLFHPKSCLLRFNRVWSYTGQIQLHSNDYKDLVTRVWVSIHTNLKKKSREKSYFLSLKIFPTHSCVGQVLQGNFYIKFFFM